MNRDTLWQPRASFETLRRRAVFFRQLRSFFEARGVLEVETPILSRGATVDPQIDSFTTHGERWLQTSPEFPMKRLLAAGSGPIFQIARVFRIDEQGRHHNPEFTMLEWYRPGWDHHALMNECEALLQALSVTTEACRRSTYREAFARLAGLDPHVASIVDLQAACRRAIGPLPDMPDPAIAAESVRRDFLLDLLMSHVVGPQLGRNTPEFLHDFPASQAALARIRQDDPPVAERFELFWRGIELANGFHELTDADEQQRRFESDRARRAHAQRVAPPYDARLIAAMRHGLPDCAGVAVGLDRLLMLTLGLPHIGDTLAFDDERA